MGRKGMRREEGEAGVSGMGWCLRAPGERLLPSPHPTRACMGPWTQPGRGKSCCSLEQPQFQHCPAPLPRLPPLPLRQPQGAASGSRDPAACHAPKEASVLGQCSAQGPHWDPGGSQACSEALRTHFWSGEVREGINVTFSSHLATLSKEVPPCYFSVAAPSSFPP